MGKAEIDAWVQNVMKLDPKTARERAKASLDAGRRSADPGLVGTALGDKYQGEETGDGRFRQGSNTKTVYFDENKKKESVLAFAADGSASAGKQELNGKKGFVIDPTTGKTHVFEQGKTGVDPADNKDLYQHHSSPLAGGEVAGAGQLEFSGKHVTEINDQSGHYKPGGEFTFQAVRQINAETLGSSIKERLSRRPSTATKKDGKWTGEAEGPDTLQQLIAAEIQVARESYFRELDQVQQSAETKAETSIPDEKERAATLDAIQMARRKKVDEFRDVAKQVEQLLTQEAGVADNPLIDSRTTSTNVPFDNNDPEASAKYRRRHEQEQLKGEYDKLIAFIEVQQKEDPTADLTDLFKKAQAAEQALTAANFDPASNQETQVTLLGKTGMLSEAEYNDLTKEVAAQTQAAEAQGKKLSDAEIADLMDQGYNKKSAIKQLAQPLGEAAYAELLKQNSVSQRAANKAKSSQPDQPAAAAPDAIAEAMRANGLEPGAKGGVEQLKALLGAKAANALSDDELLVAKQKYDVKSITGASAGGDNAGFKIGDQTSISVGAQEFLQTGGNEAQIRNKARLLDEMKAGTPPLKPMSPDDNKSKAEINAETAKAKPTADYVPSKDDLAATAAQRSQQVNEAAQAIRDTPAIRTAAIKLKIKETTELIAKKETYLKTLDPSDTYSQDTIRQIRGEIETVKIDQERLERDLKFALKET